MNETTKTQVAEILSSLPIDMQDALCHVAERAVERGRDSIRALGSRLPQLGMVEVDELAGLLGRNPSAAEELMVARCMRAIAHENP